MLAYLRSVTARSQFATKRGYVLTGGLHIKAKGKRLPNYYKKTPALQVQSSFISSKDIQLCRRFTGRLFV